MLGFLKQRRRRRILQRHAIEQTLWESTLGQIPSLAVLGADERRRLHDLAVLLLHDKAFEAAGEHSLDLSMRVRIAALACRPILELGPDCYAGFASIIVYPGEFVARGREHEDDLGVVHVGDDVLSGEAWDRGPVILAWEDVLASGQGHGFDVVAHEFAHKLDMLDGTVDGVPPLHRDMSFNAWVEAFQLAYDEFCACIDRGEDTWLDPYASESPGEFFAVCTEQFFDLPDELATHYPAVYAQLSAYFRQDPRSALRPSR